MVARPNSTGNFRETVANILKRSGSDPVPERGKKTSWSTFLGAHWATIAAIDFTTVEGWGWHGLVTRSDGIAPIRLMASSARSASA